MTICSKTRREKAPARSLFFFFLLRTAVEYIQHVLQRCVRVRRFYEELVQRSRIRVIKELVRFMTGAWHARAHDQHPVGPCDKAASKRPARGVLERRKTFIPLARQCLSLCFALRRLRTHRFHYGWTVYYPIAARIPSSIREIPLLLNPPPNIATSSRSG